MSKIRRAAVVVLALLGLGVMFASSASAGGTCVYANDTPPPSDTTVCVPI